MLAGALAPPRSPPVHKERTPWSGLTQHHCSPGTANLVGPLTSTPGCCPSTSLLCLMCFWYLGGRYKVPCSSPFCRSRGGVYPNTYICRHKCIYFKQVCPGADAFAICSWLNPLPSDLNIARISSYRKFHSTLVSGILGISAALPPNPQSLVQDGRLHYPPGYWLHLFGRPVGLFSELLWLP